MTHGPSILMGVVVGALALFLLVWFYILLPAGMAKQRNRSAVLWVLIGIVGSPLLAVLLLLALGEDKSVGSAGETTTRNNAG